MVGGGGLRGEFGSQRTIHSLLLTIDNRRAILCRGLLQAVEVHKVLGHGGEDQLVILVHVVEGGGPNGGPVPLLHTLHPRRMPTPALCAPDAVLDDSCSRLWRYSRQCGFVVLLVR